MDTRDGNFTTPGPEWDHMYPTPKDLADVLRFTEFQRKWSRTPRKLRPEFEVWSDDD